MKRFISVALTFLLLLGVFAGTFSVSAATEEDIIKTLSESPVYKHISGDITQLARSMDATDEQLDALHDIAKRFAAMKFSSNAPSAHKYTAAEIKAVLALVDEACDVLGYTYTFVPSDDPKHVRDFVLEVYDANGMVYCFDGDIIAKTGGDQNALYIAIAACGCLLLAGAAIVAKKRSKAV